MVRKHPITSLISLIVILFSGCSYHQQSLKTEINNSLKNKKETLNLQLKPLPLKPKTLLELETPTPHIHPLKVQLALRDVPLKEALLMVSKASGYNILIPPDIQGKITLEIKEDTLEDTLKALLAPFGYSYKIEDNNIYILTKVTKIFHLNLPAIKRDFTSSIQASIGGSSSGETASSTGSTSMSIQNTYSIKLWDYIEKSIKSILNLDKGATYSIEPITGTVIVTAKPKIIDKVKKFIDIINKESRKQVLIEAKILEVKLDKKNQTGINWKYLTFSNLLGSGGEYSTLSFNSGTPSQLPFQLSIVKVNQTFSAIIGVLSKFGKVNVLSSPRILSMNGQPAMIKVGKDYLLIYQSQTSSTTSTGAQTASTITTQEISTNTILTEGIILTIIPRIDDNGDIILNITPAITSLDTPLISGPTGNSLEFVNKVYAINVRELNTVVRVKNGQTIILGGLIAKSRSKEKTGVPILDQIPIIGNAFKSESQSSSKTELIIMLTPYLRE